LPAIHWRWLVLRARDLSFRCACSAFVAIAGACVATVIFGVQERSIPKAPQRHFSTANRLRMRKPY
jgi:hypothetical protein